MFSQKFIRLIARGAIAAFLFAQLAIAAYACPVIEGPAGAIAAATAQSIQDTMPGCEMGNVESNVNLCLQHCQAGDQSVQTLPQLEVPALVAVPSFALPASVVNDAGTNAVLTTAWSILVPLPPPLSRFGVLRI